MSDQGMGYLQTCILSLEREREALEKRLAEEQGRRWRAEEDLANRFARDRNDAETLRVLAAERDELRALLVRCREWPGYAADKEKLPLGATNYFIAVELLADIDSVLGRERLAGVLGCEQEAR